MNNKYRQTFLSQREMRVEGIYRDWLKLSNIIHKMAKFYVELTASTYMSKLCSQAYCSREN